MEYKGFRIERGYGAIGGFTVFFYGDDISFKTVDQAKKFIDSLD